MSVRIVKHFRTKHMLSASLSPQKSVWSYAYQISHLVESLQYCIRGSPFHPKTKPFLRLVRKYFILIYGILWLYFIIVMYIQRLFALTHLTQTLYPRSLHHLAKSSAEFILRNTIGGKASRENKRFLALAIYFRESPVLVRLLFLWVHNQQSCEIHDLMPSIPWSCIVAKRSKLYSTCLQQTRVIFDNLTLIRTVLFLEQLFDLFMKNGLHM